MKNEAEFWNQIAEKYARSPVRDMESWDETLRLTRGYLDFDHTTLEIGAGTGSSALRLHDAVSHYRATDFSPDMIAIANSKLDNAQPSNLEFASARIYDEPANSYDSVLAFNLLHLVEDIEDIAMEANRVLKSGGVFISKSACLSGKYALLRVPLKGMQLLRKAPFVNFFSRDQLLDAHRKAGFEIAESINLPKGSMLQIVVARKIGL